MLYSVLIYDSEAVVHARPKHEDDALVANHLVLQKKLAGQGKLGPVLRLMPTTTATTLRQGDQTVIVDGPFAETKEQLLGLYVIDCETLDEALEITRQIGHSCGSRSLELRPVALFTPGGANMAGILPASTAQ